MLSFWRTFPDQSVTMLWPIDRLKAKFHHANTYHTYKLLLNFGSTRHVIVKISYFRNNLDQIYSVFLKYLKVLQRQIMLIRPWSGCLKKNQGLIRPWSGVSHILWPDPDWALIRTWWGYAWWIWSGNLIRPWL